jgi:hypothetical protein
MRMAVMDFTSVDIESDRYLRHTDRKSVVDHAPDITPEERAILSQEELKESAKASVQERIAARKEAAQRLRKQNEQAKLKKDTQRTQLLSSELGRVVILGADMLSVQLGNYGDIFEIVDRKTIDESVQELSFHRVLPVKGAFQG